MSTYSLYDNWALRLSGAQRERVRALRKPVHWKPCGALPPCDILLLAHQQEIKVPPRSG